jgi:leucyl aminopeptidase
MIVDQKAHLPFAEIPFSTTHSPVEKQRSACVVLGVSAPRKLSPTGLALDAASGGALTALLKSGDLGTTVGATAVLYRPAGLACERVMLVYLGKPAELDARNYRKAAQGAMARLKDTGATEVLWCLGEATVKGRDLAWQAEQTVLAYGDAFYRFELTKSEAVKPAVLRGFKWHLSERVQRDTVQAALARGMAIVAGMSLARDLGNLPGNLCTPTILADAAMDLAESHHLGVEVLERMDLERLEMGSFLSVAKGSDEPPKFIILRYQGAAAEQRPVVLVGKGITFDAGGISLKPAAEMDEMKYDMCGAASVLGALQAVAELGLPLNVVVLIPTCENLPSGRANKPGDVVTSMSGQTIEILNTDAEGRLILCDALTYAERFNPACVVDVATLTGACVIALGHVTSGLLANDDALAHALVKAGEQAADPCWQMPLFDEYQDQLKSNFADMANIGGRAGGTITAAAFLSRFAKKYKWAHLDIAGTAWKSGKDKGSTGRPVPLLVNFLIAQAGR